VVPHYLPVKSLYHGPIKMLMCLSSVKKGGVDPPPLCEVFSVQDSMDLVTVTHTRTAQVVVVLQLRYALTETSTPYS
jgi:hypothetical protein